MNARDELLERLIRHQLVAHGELSAGAQQELARAVRKDPSTFVEGAENTAFNLLVEALERHARTKADEELIDNDDEYFASRSSRMRSLAQDCQDALVVDRNCLDAALVAALASDEEPEATLELLLDLHRKHPTARDVGPSWEDLRTRANLRLEAAIARTCLECARYRMATRACERLIAWDVADHVGARRTYALALARLEDEAAFESLDRRLARQGDAWLHLSRVILLYKLGRLDDARRALVGYARLVTGGAYALLRPVMVDTYLPDRPDVEPLGYEEACMAVWEAEPIIVDVPDLPAWAADQQTVAESAWSFAERHGLDW